MCSGATETGPSRSVPPHACGRHLTWGYAATCHPACRPVCVQTAAMPMRPLQERPLGKSSVGGPHVGMGMGKNTFIDPQGTALTATPLAQLSSQVKNKHSQVNN